MPRAVVSLPLALLSLALAPAAVGADGLPVPVDGADTASVAPPNGEGPRYATVDAGDDTRLLQIEPNGGEITGSRTIGGEFSVPLVALDGTPSGHSADGGTLALINPRTRFPRRESSFVIVDIAANGAMRPRERLTLKGDFSFDALSPDGSTLYLIEYTSRDFNDYVVREYDLERGELVRKPVLVPDEAPGEMRGLPMTRATSADGRWEYTLYDGGGDGEPFIHGLDTVESTSVCIDLPQLEGERNILTVALGLDAGDGTLSITGRGGELLATVDTETFEVSDPPLPATSAAKADGGGLSGVAVGAIAAGIALITGTAVGLRRRRRGAALPPDPFGPGEPGPIADRTSERDRVAS